MFGKLAVFAMNGKKISGLDEIQYQFQFFLTARGRRRG